MYMYSQPQTKIDSRINIQLFKYSHLESRSQKARYIRVEQMVLVANKLRLEMGDTFQSRTNRIFGL